MKVIAVLGIIFLPLSTIAVSRRTSFLYAVFFLTQLIQTEHLQHAVFLYGGSKNLVTQLVTIILDLLHFSDTGCRISADCDARDTLYEVQGYRKAI